MPATTFIDESLMQLLSVSADIAENWLNHYEANGWMVGKVKMKDWKASVRTWKIWKFLRRNRNDI